MRDRDKKIDKALHSRSTQGLPPASGQVSHSERKKSTLLRPFQGLWRFFARRPILRFVVGTVVLMSAFYGLYIPQWEPDIVGKYFLEWNLEAHARVSGAVLRLLGRDAVVSGTHVFTPEFSMQIVRGCDALEPAALFISACLAFPVARWRAKLIGILVGVICMELTNIVRIVTLYYVGVHRPQHFDMMHFEVWQALFIVLSVVYWAVWAVWASRRKMDPAHAPA